MNTLNCESKSCRKKSPVRACIITAIVSVLLTLVLVARLFFHFPAVANIILAKFYIDSYQYGEVDDSKLEQGALTGFVSGLEDKYAHYYSVDSSTDRSNHFMGINKGIGITAVKSIDSEAAYVYRVYKDSPAEKAGILKGDIITRIGEFDLLEIGFQKTFNSLELEIGETVVLSIIRNGVESELSVNVEDFTIQTVFGEVIEGYGYIVIDSFNEATVSQFKNTLEELTKEGIEGIIFDLRGNGGGTVNSTGEILDVLLPEGVLMTTVNNKGKEKVRLRSDENFVDLPMTVLTDGSTASAAELFAANIRDFEKGILIGEKTFGKGVMQTTFMLFGGKTLVLTTDEFMTHSGESYHGEGLTPDIEVAFSKEEKSNRYFYPVSEDKAVKAAIEWFEGDNVD